MSLIAGAMLLLVVCIPIIRLLAVAYYESNSGNEKARVSAVSEDDPREE